MVDVVKNTLSSTDGRLTLLFELENMSDTKRVIFSGWKWNDSALKASLADDSGSSYRQLNYNEDKLGNDMPPHEKTTAVLTFDQATETIKCDSPGLSDSGGACVYAAITGA
jgi:hypothetical protein